MVSEVMCCFNSLMSHYLVERRPPCCPPAGQGRDGDRAGRTPGWRQTQASCLATRLGNGQLSSLKVMAEKAAVNSVKADVQANPIALWRITEEKLKL